MTYMYGWDTGDLLLDMKTNKYCCHFSAMRPMDNSGMQLWKWQHKEHLFWVYIGSWVKWDSYGINNCFIFSLYVSICSFKSVKSVFLKCNFCKRFTNEHHSLLTYRWLNFSNIYLLNPMFCEPLFVISRDTLWYL